MSTCRRPDRRVPSLSWSAALLICQLTDLHVVPEGSLAYGRVPSNRMVVRALERVAALDPAPDLVVITGDLADCGRAEEYRILARALARLPQPVFVIPGNHDRRKQLRLGLAPFLPDGLEGERLHYVIEGHPVRVVMLDTIVPGHGHGELASEDLDWLDARLAERPEQPAIVAMHHPPFDCGIAHMDAIALADHGRFAEVILRHRQVERVICGHHHRPVVVRYAGTVASIAPSVAHQVDLDLRPGAEGMFVMEPPAFQLHQWSPSTGLVSHTVQVDEGEGPYAFTDEPDYPGQ